MTLASGTTTLPLSALTPCWLKDNYLVGLKFIDSAGRELPDSFYETHLQTAVRYLEELCDITILPITVRNEQHDYRITDYQNWGFLQLYKVPVPSVIEVRAVYPMGQSIAVYPPEWTQIQGNTGQLHLVPSRGALGSIIIGQGGSFLPLIYSGLSYLPFLWEVDYTAGMDTDNIPRTVADIIAKLASIEILSIMSDLARPIGVSSESVSVDGLSQSMSYQLPAFQARIARYIEDLYGPNGKNQELTMTSGRLLQLRNYYRPMTMASLY